MNWEETREFLLPCFPEAIRQELMLLQPGELREIRLRAERPTVFVTGTRTASLPWQPGPHQLEALAEALSGHSLYARAEETGQGFITLRGGHRMGLCGRVMQRKAGQHLTAIGSMCLRIAAQWPGCADALLPLARQGSLLLIGPPGSGKTTLLRDLTRQLCTGRNAKQTALIDERGELAACVSWLVRSMAPEMIITDELATSQDAAAILEAVGCGCMVCASVHGASLADAASRPALASLMARRVFRHYAVLSAEGGGRVQVLHDVHGAPVPAA